MQSPGSSPLMTAAGTEQPDYMAGCCHVYASALHRALGFPFLVLLDKSERYPGGVHSVHHVYAVDRSGFAYDYLGRHSADEVTAQWLNPETPLSRPGVVRIASERGLGKYVEKSKDGWDRPLSWYSAADVQQAMDAARERLGALLPPLCDDLESCGHAFIR